MNHSEEFKDVIMVRNKAFLSPSAMGERGDMVRGRWGLKLTKGTVEANQEEVEAAISDKLSEVWTLSSKLGGLEALKAFYGREGLGTERTEMMAKDIVYQNVLKSLDSEAKSWSKNGQPRSPQIVRSLLKTQLDISVNIKDIRANVNRSL